MELKTAQKVKQLLSDIEQVEKKIERFNNTKEFCNIEFKGEDGNERLFSFSVTQENDNELRQKIRTLVNDELKDRLEKLMSQLSDL